MKKLDVHGCKLNPSCIRVLLDGINRNQSLEFLNMSSNYLSSKTNEFAMKLAYLVINHK